MSGCYRCKDLMDEKSKSANRKVHVYGGLV